MIKTKAQKVQEIIANCTEAELNEVIAVVRAEGKIIENRKLFSFNEGDKVRFKYHGRYENGTVVKRNKTTVEVLVNGTRWNISPSFLEKVK